MKTPCEHHIYYIFPEFGIHSASLGKVIYYHFGICLLLRSTNLNVQINSIIRKTQNKNSPTRAILWQKMEKVISSFRDHNMGDVMKARTYLLLAIAGMLVPLAFCVEQSKPPESSEQSFPQAPSLQDRHRWKPSQRVSIQ
ncbi:MAG: hypothetical protein PWQ22_1229 [Archaeoglobaceae archaeon]|nr:hypothetical protein [Archaeoglobaceae archaeon]